MAFDPMTPVPDPFTDQARIREEGGVAEVRDGFHLVAGYHLVHQAFRQSDCLSNRSPKGEDSESLVHLDGEKHRQRRRLLARAFTPRAMRGTTDAVRAVAERLVENLPQSGTTDLVHSLTAPLPAIVMSDILGVPPEDRDRFLYWSDDAVAHSYSSGPAPTAGDFEQYVLRQIERARAEPGETLLDYLVDETDGQGRMTDEQLVAAVRLLIIAGNETTANMLGTLFHQLLRDRSRWETVQADRSLVPAAVEEALRYDPPLNWIPRVAADRCPVGDHEIPAGSNVGLGVGAANRDPTMFDNPDDYRLDRGDGPAKHLTFGYGEHFCLGATLARIEGVQALEVALDRLPDLALADHHVFAPKGPVMMRGVRDLPVTYTAVKATA